MDKKTAIRNTGSILLTVSSLDAKGNSWSGAERFQVFLNISRVGTLATKESPKASQIPENNHRIWNLAKSTLYNP